MRQEQVTESHSCHAVIGMRCGWFIAIQGRDDPPEQRPTEAGAAPSREQAPRVRRAAPLAGQYRAPFVRGFGYDDHPILRRVKS
jgi:hypothetical protein